ncbi:hypothetical protein BGAL_0305g00050 [Botrytis galanthina]|uniref:Aminoglycoside phosphotransferase domain-containing protein n=1 Tax=Botrytis galanthina TaxID=278940 RepID=A0A4S8QR90_9HELO|nr:hypothetical protein BGAL_0305g00050 [Botrytis galanthina]
MTSQLLTPTQNSFPPREISAIKVMVTHLCHENGFSPGILRISGIKSGSKHNIILFTWILTTLSPGSRMAPCMHYVLRTPRMQGAIPDLWILRTAAFDFISAKHFEVPKLYAYDARCGNAIRSPYIIQQQVEGYTLLEKYRVLYHNYLTYDHYKPCSDYGEAASIISMYIERQELAYQFEYYGTLQLIQGMALQSSIPDRVKDRIGLDVKPFTNTLSMKANSKAIDFILELLFMSESQMRNPDQEVKYRKIRHIALCIKVLDGNDIYRAAHRPEPSVLWHPNFQPSKIMMTATPYDENASDVSNDDPTRIESYKLEAVLGWEGVMALPRIMTRCPPYFCWGEGPQVHVVDKCIWKYTCVDEMIEEGLPGWCEDAYGEMSRIVRALGFYALFGVDFEWYELPFEVLIDAWMLIDPETRDLEYATK